MTDSEKAAAVLGMVEQWLDCDECDITNASMALDVAFALDRDEVTFSDAMRAELRRIASVLRGDAVGSGPAAPEGVRRNCWTCRWNDVEDGNACRNSVVAANWIAYTSLDDDTLMPNPNSDGCPGWGQR